MQPAPGDLVILRLTQPTLDCSVSVAPGPPFRSFASYDDALAWARQTAVRARLDVWVIEDSQVATLVSRHRRDLPRVTAR
jgi:hypothetical protein